MKSRVLPALVLLGLVSCGESTPEPVSEVSDPPATVEPTPTSPRPYVSPEVLAGIRAREAGRSARALAEVERRFASRTPGLSFRVRRVRTNGLGDTHVWLQQVFQGTPVAGRDLGVIVFADEELRVLGTPDDFGDVVAPRMTVAAGLARARAHVKARGLALKTEAPAESLLEPVYEQRLKPGAGGGNAADYETVVSFERVVRVRLGTPAAPGVPSELLVRERDGAVLERGKPPRVDTAATLRSRYAGTVTSLHTFYDSTKGHYVLWSSGLDKVSMAEQPDGTLPRDYTSTTNDWGDGQFYAHQSPLKANGQTAAADAYISLYGVRRMWSDVYLQDSWDGNGAPVQAMVHYPEANAFAVGTTTILLGYLYDNEAPNNLSDRPLTDIETVGHEVGHLAFHDMTGVFTSDTGELSGMNEGTADLFGVIAGFHLPNALANVDGCGGRTCTGRWPITVRNDWVAGNVADSRFGRSLIDPFQFPAWTPAIRTADGHDASGPLRRMFYFLSVGVLPEGVFPQPGLTKPQRGSPYLKQGLVGLGIDTANWLWYHTLSGIYFSRITGYHDAREMMLEATMALYQRKPYTPQYKAVEDAWAAVNVGPPADRKPPTVSVTPLQTARDLATLTVDLADDNGIASGTVVITSSLNGLVSTHSCTGHCVITLNPVDYGTHTAHSVKVTARDTRENEVVKQSFFALDIAYPGVIITSNKGAGWPANAPQQDWRYSATDNTGLASMTLLLDGVPVVGEAWSSPYPPSFALPSVVVDVSNRPEGRYIARFETRDIFGNTRPDTYHLYVDNTPPELCTQTVTVDPSNNGQVHLTTTGRDNVSGLSLLTIQQTTGGVLKRDQAEKSGGVQHSLSHTATFTPGTYTFFGTCTDRRSNVSRTPNQTVTVLGRCNTMAVAGGAQMDVRSFAMGKTSGTVTLTYQTYTVHDRIRVYSGTTLVADTGCTATGDETLYRTKTFTYSGTTGQLKVQVDPNCDPATAQPTTEWQYSLSCP